MDETTDQPSEAVDGRPCTSCGATVPTGRSVCPSCKVLQAPAPYVAPAATPPPPLQGWPAPPPPTGQAHPVAPSAPFAAPDATPGPMPPTSSPPQPPPGGIPGYVPSAGPPRPMDPAPSAYLRPPNAPYLPGTVVSRPPAARTRFPAWIVLLVVLVTGAVIGGAIWLSEEDSDTERASAQGSDPESVTSTTYAPTDRVTQVPLLVGFCDGTPAKWPEVPIQVPGEPARTYVVVDSAGDTDSDGASNLNGTPATGGSTVVSPRTDGRYTKDPEALNRTRSVTCVQYESTEQYGQACEYSEDSFGMSGIYTLNLHISRYSITVYELHSGGVMARGELFTSQRGCPDHAMVGGTNATVGYPLEDQQILQWLGEHFIDGKAQ